MGALPSSDALRKCIQQKCNQLHAPPLTPASVAELVIPDEYQTYSPIPGQGSNLCITGWNSLSLALIADERFLLIDTGPESAPSRILVFGRRQTWKPWRM